MSEFLKQFGGGGIDFDIALLAAKLNGLEKDAGHAAIVYMEKIQLINSEYRELERELDELRRERGSNIK